MRGGERPLAQVSSHAGSRFSEVRTWGEGFGRKGVSAAEAWIADFKGVQAERRVESARVAAIRGGAETDPVEISMLQLEDDPDFASFNIVEDWN